MVGYVLLFLLGCSMVIKGFQWLFRVRKAKDDMPQTEEGHLDQTDPTRTAPMSYTPRVREQNTPRVNPQDN